MPINWFLGSAAARPAAARLFCLPYAGGSAAVYRTWAGQLPSIEVLALQLPGRGWRLRETPRGDLDVLADEVAAAILPRTTEPFAVFGHSMGSWLGLEVVRRLEAAGRHPLRLFASGRQAPGLGCTQPGLSHLDDGAFVQEVQTRYGGIPREIASEPELLELLLPALRADIALLEAYRHRPVTAVRTPIHTLVGDSDPMVSAEEMRPWVEETSGAFRSSTLPGGHFYFQPDPSALLEIIRSEMEASVGSRAMARAEAS
jgi:surfactin synthase thioesterase subunit